MTVYPVDDCTFWYTQEYFATNGGSWRTRIGNFKFPSCVATPHAAILSPPSSSLTNEGFLPSNNVIDPGEVGDRQFLCAERWQWRNDQS